MRFTIVCLATIGVLAGCYAVSQAQKPQLLTKTGNTNNAQIDFDGFLKMSADVKQLRERRRVDLKRFLSMAKDKNTNTIILDTRSKKAFDEAHWKGAVHLNFSDFTAEKLAKVIPDKKTRILIYCNNNFEEAPIQALALKSAPLALNIPTFINLHGYGYENVFELADKVKVNHPMVPLVGTEVQPRLVFDGC